MKVTIEIPTWATHIVSDLTDMDRNPHPVDATKVSRFSLELPDDVYFEYGFLDQEGRIRPDPANERRADNPWYPGVSALVGPDYRPDPFADVDASLATGSLARMRWESERMQEVRRVNVYTPAGYDGALPVVLVQDGTAYLRIAHLPAVLEALLADGGVAPARLVMVEPTDRWSEYGFNDAYRAFVEEEVLPRVGERFGEPSSLHAMGASLGGLFSFALALRRPDLIAGVAAQSGAFLGTPEGREFYRTERSWVLESLQGVQEARWRAYTEVGTLEWLTHVNRRVHEQLERRAVAHTYAERNAGHNWTNWRNGLAAALRFLLPPPGS